MTSDPKAKQHNNTMIKYNLLLLFFKLSVHRPQMYYLSRNKTCMDKGGK